MTAGRSYRLRADGAVCWRQACRSAFVWWTRVGAASLWLPTTATLARPQAWLIRNATHAIGEVAAVTHRHRLEAEAGTGVERTAARERGYGVETLTSDFTPDARRHRRSG